MPTISSPTTASGAHRALVLAAFSESVWRALASLPSLECLSGSIFPRISRAIRAVAFRRLKSVEDPAGGQDLVVFPRHGGFDRFQVEVAGTIVRRLEGRLGWANNLDLINRTIPNALARTLSSGSRPGSMRPQAEHYRLVGAMLSSREDTTP